MEEEYFRHKFCHVKGDEQMAEKHLRHEGIVEGSDGIHTRVRLTGHIACSGCHARGACSISGKKDKTLAIPDRGSSFQSGDKVHVALTQSLCFRALFLGYILPFLIVVSVLIILSSISKNELVNGLASLAVLFPYYLCIRLLRSRIDSKFCFTLKKQGLTK